MDAEVSAARPTNVLGSDTQWEPLLVECARDVTPTSDTDNQCTDAQSERLQYALKCRSTYEPGGDIRKA